MTSNREKKRIVQAGVRRVMATTGWNPRTFHHDEDTGTTGRAAGEIRQARTDSVYCATDECADCVLARNESGDPTALCARHLKEALGM